MGHLKINSLDYFQSVSADELVKGGRLIYRFCLLRHYFALDLCRLVNGNTTTQPTSVVVSSTAQSVSMVPSSPTSAVASASVTAQGVTSSTSLSATVS